MLDYVVSMGRREALGWMPGRLATAGELARNLVVAISPPPPPPPPPPLRLITSRDQRWRSYVNSDNTAM